MKKVIDGFRTLGGQHCVTTALRQVFNFYGHDISEEMLFGLGSGLGFVYINLAQAPLISGRIKTLEFEAKIAKRLNVKIEFKKSKDNIKIFEKTKKMIDNNEPVLLFADMPYLKYLNLNENSHFGGHAVVIFGYDDEKEHFYVSDRDNSDKPMRTPCGDISEDFHLVSYEQIERARSSNYKPFPANNKYFEFDFSEYSFVSPHMLTEAILETRDNMLNSPANLLGVTGIMKFSSEVLKWNKFDNEKLKRAGISNFFMINADGGTGGGLFRKMYGNFLIEAGRILNNNCIEKLGLRFIGVAGKWDGIAGLLWDLWETGDTGILKTISCMAGEIGREEEEILDALCV